MDETPRERKARLWHELREHALREKVASFRGSSDTRHHYNGRYRIGEGFAMSDGHQYTVASDGSFRHTENGEVA